MSDPLPTRESIEESQATCEQVQEFSRLDFMNAGYDKRDAEAFAHCLSALPERNRQVLQLLSRLAEAEREIKCLETREEKWVETVRKRRAKAADPRWDQKAAGIIGEIWACEEILSAMGVSEEESRS